MAWYTDVFKWIGRNPEIAKSGLDLAKGAMQGKGQEDLARQNQANTAAQNALDQYSRDFWAYQQARQNALNSALSTSDPLRDQQSLFNMGKQADLYGNPDLHTNFAGLAPAVSTTTSSGASTVGRGWMPRVSQPTLARLQSPALASALEQRDQNLITQSKGQYAPVNLNAALGEPGFETAQQRLADAQKAAASGFETEINDYRTAMDKGYGQTTTSQEPLSGEAAQAAGMAPGFQPMLIDLYSKWAKKKNAATSARG